MSKLISLIIPVYNEEKNLKLFFEALLKTSDFKKEEFVFEFIFVNDGSRDNSAETLMRLAQMDARVKVIDFSRNFGKEAATSAGLFYAQGEAAIIIDADRQHPAELIPEFLNKWIAGAEVVIGFREINQGEGLVKRWGSKLFYKIMNAIGETKFIHGETDFRLVDRKVIDEFNKFTERNRMTRGLIDWLGFKKDYVRFEAKRREAGKAGYSFSKLVRLAMSSFVTYSLFPLKLAGYLGIIITFLSGLFGLFILIERYILRNPLGLYISGPAQLAVLILFFIGVVLICLGLIALYIGNIHSEVVNRPLFVIRGKKNMEHGARNM